MRRALAIYRQYIRISFNTAAAYRASFLLTVIISLFSNLFFPLLTVLIYSGGARIPGWSFDEALLLQAVFMLCTGISSPFLSNMVWITMEHIRQGTYDTIMLKPGSTLLITAASAFDLENIGSLFGGLALFMYSLYRLPTPGISQWLGFLLMLIMGLCVMLGATLLMTATTFKWVGNSRIYEIFDAVTAFGRYPNTIYSRSLRTLAAYIIPVSMLGFFPASALLGRSLPEMFFACIPCIVFMALGLIVFRRMIYRYQSAGG